MSHRIPYNRPMRAGNELLYIEEAIKNGHVSGNGQFTKRCEDFLGRQLGDSKVLLTNSCTSALEMAAILSNVTENDEVILPSFTFVSTANAFLKRRAKIKFVEISSDTLTINIDHAESLLTERTKCIVPVHYAGMSCDMDRLMSVAKRSDTTVIEDAAQCIGSKYKGQSLGSIGQIGTLSFHETKNISCGEGGALILNAETYLSMAEIIREKGTNRSKFFRGEVDKYTWVAEGSAFLPSDISAAYLLAQLELMEAVNKKRMEIWNFYYNSLQPLEEKGTIRLPKIPVNSKPNGHIFYILVSEQDREKLLIFLKNRGIHAVFHYIPLHLSPMGNKLGYQPGDLPISEQISNLYKIWR